MKKIIILILLLILSGCEQYTDIVDCKENDEIGGLCIDLTAPTFSGIEDTTIIKGDNFGPMTSVFASDDLDGDVTEHITYTGSVNKNELGTYLLTYRVSDSAGNETIALRYITVDFDVNSITSENLILNGAFDNNMDGWSTYISSDGSAADIYVADSVLIVEVGAVVNGAPWDPRVEYQGLPYINGETYVVTFKIKSDEAILFQVQIGELINQSPWFIDYNESMTKQFMSTTEYTEITFTFIVNKDTTFNGCILLEFGSLSPGHTLTTFYIDDVSIHKLD